MWGELSLGRDVCNSPRHGLHVNSLLVFSLEFPPLSICANIYTLRLDFYYFNPTECRGMNIVHPLCVGYKNRLLIYTYAQCDYANNDWYM